MKSCALAEPVLVGREKELNELQSYLYSSIEGRGTVVFVSGEAGSGKTRLICEFLDQARNQGITVLTGWCLSNATVPYFPFIEAFESYAMESNEGVSSIASKNSSLETFLIDSEHVGGLSSREQISPQVWKDQRFAAVTKGLLFLSTEKPLILFIDDLHWADSASLTLLHYIAKSIGSERILILATYRSEELTSDGQEFAHPLLDTLLIMGREDLHKEVKLSNLSQVNVGDIAENMLGGAVCKDLVEKLSEESRGNALFVIESLRMLFENGGIFKANNQWALASDKVGVPTKVKDIILRRLIALKPNQRRTLDIASVIGDKFDPQLLGAVLNQDSLEVLETLNTIALSKSLVCVEGDYYRFDHAKSREVLYDEILLPLKKGYHERIAERIETLRKDDGTLPLSDLAYHYTQAGNKPKSIRFSLAVGKDAYARFSNVEAIKNFTYVINAVGENTQLFEEKTVALEGLGDALFASMRLKEARQTFENLAALGGVSRVRALRKAMEASFFQNDLPHLSELIKEAEECDVTDRLENARIIMNKGRVFSMQSLSAVATKYFEQALRVFEEEYSLFDTAWDLIALGSNAPGAGKLEESFSAVIRSIALLQELGDLRWLVEAYNMAGLTFVVYFGFWQEGMDMFEKAAKVNEDSKIGDYLRLAQLNAERAWALSSMGDLNAAVTKSLEALSYSEKTDSHWAKGMAYGNLTMYYAMLGEGEQAEKFFGKLMQLPKEVLLNPNVNAPMATALFFAGKNQWDQSNQVFKETLDFLKAHPNPGVEAIVKMCYAWVLGRQGRGVEALAQVQSAQKFYQDMARRFEHVNLQATLMVPIHVTTDQPFEARLDFVNVSRGTGKLIKVENVIPAGIKVISLSTESSLKDGSIVFKDSSFGPFAIKTAKLILQTTKTGVFSFKPRAVFIDDLKETKASETKLIDVFVTSKCAETQESREEEIGEAEIVFKSENARKVFDFLVSAYKIDYFQGSLPKERSGWRTLMNIIKDGKVSKHMAYGSLGKHGQAIIELENAGLVEVRVFEGERGRGGKILKVRAAYENKKVEQRISAEK